MSLEVIRQSLVTAVEAAKVGFSGGYTLLIEYDNRVAIDTQTQQNPYLMVSVKVIDGDQIDLHTNPTQRFTGQMYVTACVKEGTGTAKATQLLDHFYPRLQLKAFGPVRTRMAVPTRPVPNLGWMLYPVIVPFWMDKIW